MFFVMFFITKIQQQQQRHERMAVSGLLSRRAESCRPAVGLIPPLGKSRRRPALATGERCFGRPAWMGWGGVHIFFGAKKNPQCASRHPSGRRIQMPSKKKIMSSKCNKCYGGEGIGLRGGGRGGERGTSMLPRWYTEEEERWTRKSKKKWYSLPISNSTDHKAYGEDVTRCVGKAIKKSYQRRPDSNPQGVSLSSSTKSRPVKRLNPLTTRPLTEVNADWCWPFFAIYTTTKNKNPLCFLLCFHITFFAHN